MTYTDFGYTDPADQPRHRKEISMTDLLPALRSTAKAVAALAVCAAAYLVGILSGDQALSDVTTVQWLGLVVFMGGAYGITWAVPNRPGPPVQVTGTVVSETGERGHIDATLKADDTTT